MEPATSPRIPIVDIDAHPPLTPMPVDHIGELSAISLLDRLSRAGIDIACGRLTPPPGFFDAHAPEDAIAALNRGALNLMQTDSRYLPALWIHPDCPDYSMDQLGQYTPLGVRMIGVEAKWLDHPGMQPILTRAQTLDMVVSLQDETISQADELAGQFPSLAVLIGGLGSSGYMPAITFDLLQSHSNLLLNLSGVIWGFNYALHEWTERLGADRLFFGSGYPFSNPAGKLAALRWELRDQADSVCRQIFSENALQLAGAERRIS